MRLTKHFHDNTNTCKPTWINEVGSLSTHFGVEEVLSRMITVSQTDLQIGRRAAFYGIDSE